MKNQYNPNTYCSLAFAGFDSRAKSVCCFARLDQEYNSFKELNESAYVDRFRHDLLSGTQHPACKTCWDIESALGLSMRQQQSKLHRKSNEDIEQEYSSNRLKFLVLDTGNSCNLACRTCGPTDSSGLFNEYKSKIKQFVPIIRTPNYSFPIEDLYNLEDISVLGGEPFLNTDHILLLEQLVQLDRAKYCSLSYTSNGTTKINNHLKSLFQKFRRVIINYSLDAVGKPSEYIRTGSSWEQVQSNIEHVLYHVKPQCTNMTVSGNTVLSVLNLFYIDPLYEWFDQHCMFHTTTYCADPDYYSYNLFTDRQKELIEDKLKKSHHDLKHILEILKSSKYDPSLKDKFDFNTKFTENYRNLKLADYLPELENLLNIV